MDTRIRLSRRLRALGALVAFAIAPAVVAAPGGTVEFHNAYWFDGDGFTSGSRYVIDGVITEALPARIDRREDLGGRWVVPAFAEAHNHNLQNAWGAGRWRDMYLRDGVFHAAMLCGDAEGNQAVREALAGRDAPRVVFTSCVSSSDGHPLRMALREYRQADPDTGPEVVHDRHYVVMDTPADVAAKWPLVQAARPDLVKAILLHSEDPTRRGDPAMYGVNGLEPEVLPVLVERARADGLRVAAHTESAADFAVAVGAGVDIIAHLPGYRFWPGKTGGDYRIDDATIAAAAARGVVVVPTASIAELVAGNDLEALAAVQAVQADNLARLKAAGVPLAMGSDRFDATSIVEYDYLLAGGLFDRRELLRMLSVDTPRLLQPDARVGCLEDGCVASFVALDADPLAADDAIHRIGARVLEGRVLEID
ncbi:amidohydrolase family protein [Luteimonas granuli]|uniref:Amidohydrolase family protein n=1 Tax=Luteimonas granuli TaxID=1176533 RepID=A0A518N456_9GAMM|nr:amidohydrolase family protein [Luteimonas granuli]QDW66684.1 amidohydrolase family protein [Luteimonas granuli]